MKKLLNTLYHEAGSCGWLGCNAAQYSCVSELLHHGVRGERSRFSAVGNG